MNEVDATPLSLLEQAHGDCRCDNGSVLPMDEQFCMDMNTVLNNVGGDGFYRSAKLLGRMFGVSYQTIYNRSRAGSDYKYARYKAEEAAKAKSSHITTTINIAAGGPYFGSFTSPLTVQG